MNPRGAEMGQAGIFLPPFEILLHGSLPFHDPAAGREWLAGFPLRLGVRAQYPQLLLSESPLGGDMISEVESGLIDRASFVVPDNALGVKDQCVGPMTYLKVRSCSGEDASAEQILSHLRNNVLARLDVLETYSQQKFFFFDEPMLIEPIGSEEERERALSCLGELLDLVKARGIVTGVHSCAFPRSKAHQDILAKISCDILALPLEEDCDECFLNQFAQQGSVCFGLGERWFSNFAGDISAAARQIGSLMQKNVLRGADPQRTYLSPECGFGLLRVEQAEANLRNLILLREKLRNS